MVTILSLTLSAVIFAVASGTVMWIGERLTHWLDRE
jgi:hypothetical protein